VCEITESCPTGSQSSFNASIGDTITIQCSMNYNGSTLPVLQWSPGATATDCSSSGTVCSSLTLNIQSGMTIVESQSCSVAFPSAVYVPECDKWTSTEIMVSCM